MKRIFLSVLLLLAVPMALAQQTAGRASAMEIDPNSMVKASLQAAQLVDAGRTGEIWDSAATVAKSTVSKEAFVKQIMAARAPLGQPTSRVWISVIRQSVPAPQAGQAAAAPPGNYVSVRFATHFSSGRTVTELLTFRLEDEGIWRVAGYTLQ